MTASQILQPLSSKTPEELLRDVELVREAKAKAERAEAEARGQRERLEVEEAALTQILAWLRSVSGADTALDAADEPEPEHAAPPPSESSARPTPKRGAIIQMMRAHPERDGWSPPEVREGLASQGIEATTNLIRVTLRRMVSAGQLVRLDDGRYSLGPARGPLDMGVT